MEKQYAVMQKEKSRELRCAIRSVFVEVWDPIRVMDDPTWPRDEYDSYIGGVFELLTTGGNDRQIEDHLLDATRRMGMDGSRASLAMVLAAIRSIDLGPN